MSTDVVVRAVPVVDELVTESGAVVMLRSGERDKVLRLSPLASVVRTFSGAGMPLSLVAAHLATVFGGPASGDPIEATRAVVAELEALGLVTVER